MERLIRIIFYLCLGYAIFLIYQNIDDLNFIEKANKKLKNEKTINRILKNRSENNENYDNLIQE